MKIAELLLGFADGRALLLSLRVPAADIELARAQAEEKGLRYQPYLKSLLHQALVRERNRRKAAR